MKALRVQKCLSLQELADVLGIAGKGDISKWENGKVVPRQKTIRMYAEYFNVSESWILNGSEEVDLNKRLDLIEQKLDLILNILQGGK